MKHHGWDPTKATAPIRLTTLLIDCGCYRPTCERESLQLVPGSLE